MYLALKSPLVPQTWETEYIPEMQTHLSQVLAKCVPKVSLCLTVTQNMSLCLCFWPGGPTPLYSSAFFPMTIQHPCWPVPCGPLSVFPSQGMPAGIVMFRRVLHMFSSVGWCRKAWRILHWKGISGHRFQPCHLKWKQMRPWREGLF